MFFILLFLLEALITTVIAQQCVPYSSGYNFTNRYPPIWQKPTSQIFNTDEFQQLNRSIDWSKVPNTPPRKMVNGVLDRSTYPVTDPDCWWSYNLCTKPKAPGIPADIYMCPEPGTWGLTYDDGPNCSHTMFYDYLKQNNQSATMFFIGSNVADLPFEAQRAYSDKHHLSVHTWSHQSMTTLTNDEVLAELYYTKKIMKEVIGVTPRTWRPPFGDCDDRIRAIALQLNLSTILWNEDSNDWNMVPAGAKQPTDIDAIFQGLVDLGLNGTYATSGLIVLQHELNNGTMSKAIEWYPKIKSAYKHIVPIASCMNITHPYEENITYPSFAEYIGMPGNNSGTTNNNNGAKKSSSSVSISSYSSFISRVIAILIALYLVF